MKKTTIFLLCMCVCTLIGAQETQHWSGKFEQLGTELPTPNGYRTGDGSPGPQYWQQRADYKIAIRLNDDKQRIDGEETITYYNQSPHPLQYLWLQLEQNRRADDSDDVLTRSFGINTDSVPGKAFASAFGVRSMKGGMHITSVKNKNGNKLSYTINKTMMRIDLPQPLAAGAAITFSIKWWYNINNRMEDSGRSGYEYFPDDDNYLYTIAQFYPRMAVYDDYEGWQHKQFLGKGEFALTFGNFDVEITVPDDHLVAATGELQNSVEVLSEAHFRLLEKARKSFSKPIIIATEAEAREREKHRSKKYNTWKYRAENVRDFAFASSRKFIWDAQAVRIGNKTPLAMSLYPKEGNPLWEQESTKAVINTLKTYSKYTIDYPYPVAISIHTAAIGMEYPMICFNFGRPNPDRTYSDGIKYNMIGVIIHEVGHNFFPMIVNSDERQWTWMDEGLNSFLEFRTAEENYENYPHSRGPATTIVKYMKGQKDLLRPVMTNSEQIPQLGNNAYGKPAAALNILREVVMGKELFDKALKTYAQRWAFKHPKPADFFRTMEDASGIDLDWFWRGWFYTTDHVDIAIDTVIWHRIGQAPHHSHDITKGEHHYDHGPSAPSMLPQIAAEPHYFEIIHTPDMYYWEFLDRVDDKKVRQQFKDKNFYEIQFTNEGGLVMPIILEFTLENGKKERRKIPAEIWRYNEYNRTRIFYFDDKVISVQLDPDLQTADTDTEDNVFPRQKTESEFERFKRGKG